MSNLIAADPLALVAIEAGLVGAPLADAAAQGSSKLDSQQRSIEIGEPVPIVFCRRDEVAGTGGVLISPGASEARFENDASNNVTAYYHLVLSEGQIDSIQVRDVFQRSCRVGSHTQTYNRRAGTWSPGNVIVAREGYDMPECPYYCGSVGTYTGMSTLSFEVTIPNGFDYWNRQVHCFIRGGMRVTRLVDSVSGASNNYADLVNWCLANSSKIPSSLIDTTALTTTANFLATNKFNCDIAITESTNLPDLLGKLSPYFLVTETRNLGKRGLRPLLPITAGYAINTSAISWEYTFTEDHILPGSFQISYTPLADRKPFCAQMIWRQQLTDDFGIIRTSEVRYAGTAENGPFEQHDMSAFCTVENHAVKAGAYILARRRYITHTLRFSCRPGAFNTTLVPGDIVRVTLTRAASSAAATSHDYLYELNRITKTLKGDLTLELTHFPVDSQGRSLVALDVASTTGTGILLTSNKSGVGCDINSSSDQTVPAEEYTDGTAADSQIVVGGYNESAPGESIPNIDDSLDTPQSSHVLLPAGSEPIAGVGMNPMAAGGPCGPGQTATLSWYKDGVLLVTYDMSGANPVITYEAEGANKPAYINATQGILMIQVGDEGSVYTSETTCKNGTVHRMRTTVKAGSILPATPIYNSSWSTFSSYYGQSYSGTVSSISSAAYMTAQNDGPNGSAQSYIYARVTLAQPVIVYNIAPGTGTISVVSVSDYNTGSTVVTY